MVLPVARLVARSRGSGGWRRLADAAALALASAPGSTAEALRMELAQRKEVRGATGDCRACGPSLPLETVRHQLVQGKATWRVPYRVRYGKADQLTLGLPSLRSAPSGLALNQLPSSSAPRESLVRSSAGPSFRPIGRLNDPALALLRLTLGAAHTTGTVGPSGSIARRRKSKQGSGSRIRASLLEWRGRPPPNLPPAVVSIANGRQNARRFAGVASSRSPPA